MSALPEDDAPTMTGTPGERRADIPTQVDDDDGSDDTTTAEGGPPASRVDQVAPAESAGADADDRTVEQKVDAVPAAAMRPPAATPGPKPSGPPPAPRPLASPAEPSELGDDDLTEDEPLEDSITTTAPRLDPELIESALSARGLLPLNLPGSVEIRTVRHHDDDDDLLDETEVRTRPGHLPLDIPAALRSSPAPRPAAGMPPPAAKPKAGSAADDEPPTRPGAPPDEPPTRPGLEESPTRPRPGEPVPPKRLDANSYANEDDDDDESVTTRAHPIEPYDDSVTTQAPAVPPSLVEAALLGPSGLGAAPLDDGTGGTTQKVHKTREAALSSPADGEAESITTQAPGPLTNILRVIASGSAPDIPGRPLDDDEPPENRTAVMANAPLKRIISEVTGASTSSLPPIRPTGPPLTHGPRGSAAPQLDRSSESGLRVAGSGSGTDDRASLSALGLAADARTSGVGPIGNALASDGSISISAPLDIRAQLANEMALLNAQQPSVHDVDLGKGPRYGLLVGIVAVISVIVPVTLFVVLHRGSESPTPGTPSEPASEIEKHDSARGKGARGKNGTFVAVPSASASASVAPAASASAATSASGTKPGAPRGAFPFKR